MSGWDRRLTPRGTLLGSRLELNGRGSMIVAGHSAREDFWARIWTPASYLLYADTIDEAEDEALHVLRVKRGVANECH